MANPLPERAVSAAAITFVEPRLHDIGGLSVRRAIPHMVVRSIGPFVFLDHIGPHAFSAGEGMDVRPHPHMGLATVTYLFEGAMMHRDSLGHIQVIRPGDVNWMTAGRGIVHSERTPLPERSTGHRLHAIQTWVALPRALEEADPDFFHYEAATLPCLRQNGVSLHVVAGSAFGAVSPVVVPSPTLYVAAKCEPGTTLRIPTEHVERAVYTIEGELALDGVPLPVGKLAVLPRGVEVTLSATAPSHAMLLGGAPLDAHRFVWWNFVSSSRERIERAKDNWRAQRFGAVPGETEFIPLPG